MPACRNGSAFRSPNPSYAKITLLSMVGIAGVIEIIGGALVTVGLYTRAAAFIMSGEMAVAYWYYANRPAKGFMPDLERRHAPRYCFVSSFST